MNEISDEMFQTFWFAFNDSRHYDEQAQVRAGLAALVASGFRPEADVLREAAASVDRHADSYELVTGANLDRMKAKGRSEEDIRRRRAMERRYVRGLLAAVDDLYELAEQAEKRTAEREQAQPPVTDGLEVQERSEGICGEVGTSFTADHEPHYTEPCALPWDHEEPHDWAQREAAGALSPAQLADNGAPVADGLEERG